MSLETKKVVIVGAGVSGLIAALELEKKDIKPIILEKENSIGGRLRTDFDVATNLPMDFGFQVLLSAYPMAMEYLDYEKLDLKYFSPGVLIIKNNKRYIFGDPKRDKSFFFPLLFSDLMSFSDKIKLYKLSEYLKKKSIEDLFDLPQTKTKKYLKEYGFSDSIIENFFKPFYSGIFLEEELNTSSSMFLFVFKMFAEGFATIPSKGISAIPNQLKNKLKQTQIKLNSEVIKINDSNVELSNGDIVNFDYLILTAPNNTSNSIVKDEKPLQWHSCTNLYFKSKDKGFGKPIIALIPDSDSYINNLHILNDIFKTNNETNIISVTVLKDFYSNNDEIIKKVESELRTKCDFKDLEFLKIFKIEKALPVFEKLSYVPRLNKSEDSNKIIFAGDYLSYASLNAAMLSGKLAAKEII